MLLKKEEVEKMTQIQGLIRFDDQQVASVAGVHVQTLIKAKNRSGKLSTNTINKIKEFITLYGDKALKTKVIEATPETVETSQEDMVTAHLITQRMRLSALTQWLQPLALSVFKTMQLLPRSSIFGERIRSGTPLKIERRRCGTCAFLQAMTHALIIKFRSGYSMPSSVFPSALTDRRG